LGPTGLAGPAQCKWAVPHFGTQYMDEILAMGVDTDNDGDCLDFDDTTSNPEGGAERYFYCQDANWNVIALRSRRRRRALLLLPGCELERDRLAPRLQHRRTLRI